MSQRSTLARYMAPRRSQHGPYREPRSALIPGRITRREWLRFLSKVHLGDRCHCNDEIVPHRHWIWTAGRKDGYGRFKWRGRMYSAHRFAAIAVGRTIPPGMEPDHLCRIRACCNPECLDIVSQRENWRRGEAPSADNHRKTHCLHGHPLMEDNLLPYGMRQGLRVCKKCFYRRNKQWLTAHPHWRALMLRRGQQRRRPGEQLRLL